MAETNTIARFLHDAGLAVWFGGSLMGDVGLNGAAADAKDPTERNRIASEGWKRWTPVNLAAVGAHLVGAVLLTVANRQRVASQKGVAPVTIAKTVVTGAALAATAYSRVLGQRQMDHPDAPSAGATEPTADTPSDLAKAQRQQRVVQWSVPALTGVLVFLTSLLGEQQRPAAVSSGIVSKLFSD